MVRSVWLGCLGWSGCSGTGGQGSGGDKKYFAASLTEVLDLVNCMNGILFKQCVNGERCLFYAFVYFQFLIRTL